MNLEEFKDKLRKYKNSDILITDHADMQAFSRRIDINEVKNNILHPDKLVYFNKQEFGNAKDDRYECFFEYSKNMYHKYVVILNGKIIIVTIIAVNRGWQGAIKK